VFRISPGGSFNNLYTFNGNDGAFPYAGLMRGNDGNFYGTTEFGGGSSSGVVFRISPMAVSRIFIRSAAVKGPFRLPGLCRAATAISTAQPLEAE